VQGREKHLYSIYRKMREKHLSFAQVLDVFGFRLVVKSVHACYIALGALHGLFKPIPGKFKDYIAIPKANGYQSLHTTLFGPFGTPMEIQIRTTEMHKIAKPGSPRTGVRFGYIAFRIAEEDPPVAAEPAGDAIGIRRLDRVPGTPQGRSFP
jgi:hypothetical protein